MRRCRSVVSVALIFALLCFSTLVVPSELAAQESGTDSNPAEIDSQVNCGNSSHRGDARCHGLTVRLTSHQNWFHWGDPAVLHCLCKDADTCERTPQIGPLPPNASGFNHVCPKKTAKYTFTGNRRGRVETASVTIAVINMPPNISIVRPENGSILTIGTADTVPAEIEFDDNAGIDTDSFRARINNSTHRAYKKSCRRIVLCISRRMATSMLTTNEER